MGRLHPLHFPKTVMKEAAGSPQPLGAGMSGSLILLCELQLQRKPEVMALIGFSDPVYQQGELRRRTGSGYFQL